MDTYWELQLRTLDEETQELLIAMLDSVGFEGFVQPSPQELLAYSATPVESAWLQPLVQAHRATIVRLAPVPQQNWNHTWEANYTSVAVDDLLLIHPEHLPPDDAQRSQFAYTLCVQPQMSFGTGHHATTRLMVRAMHDLDFGGRTALDMGCGTGVLGIHALQRGTAHVDLVDIDEWAVANTRENLARNGLAHAAWDTWQGDASSLPFGPRYDVILANIHRNVLLADADVYRQRLRPGGWILLSGFLDLDDAAILAKFLSLEMASDGQWTEREWVCRRMLLPA